MKITDDIETESALTHYSWFQLVRKALALQKRIERGPICHNCECGICESARKGKPLNAALNKALSSG